MDMIPFLRTLIECTLTMSAITLALWLLSPVLTRRYNVAGLYWAWCIVLLGFLIPFRFHAAKPPLTLPAEHRLSAPVFAASLPQPMPEPELEPEPVLALETAATDAPARALPTLTLAHLLAAAWLLGAAVSLLLRLHQHLRFLRTLRRWRKPPADPRYAAALLAAEASLGCVSGATLWICPAVTSPMMIGLFRPAILLPEIALEALELEIVLRHELVHWRRGDVWFRLCAMLASALHWFNPLLPLAARAQAFYGELSCDAVVTRGADLDMRQFYSETILRVIRRQHGPHTSLSTSFYAGKSGMKRRIFSIMDAAGKRIGGGIAAAVMLSLLCFGMVFALDAPEAAPAAAPTEAPTAAPAETPTVAPTIPPTVAPTGEPEPELIDAIESNEELLAKLHSGPPQHTWPLEEKARWLGASHGLPGAGDIPQEEALRIANEALLQKYGSSAWFSELTPYFSFIVDDSGYFEVPNWQIDYFDERDLTPGSFGRMVYEVKVSAKTGEVIYLMGPGEGNG